MKKYFSILLSALALAFITPSCGYDDSDPDTVEYPEYEAVTFSLTATIVPTDEKIDGVEMKKTFAAGDAIVVTNYSVLLEPAVLVCEDCAGKGTATFSGELKVRAGASLTGDTRLAAALTNTVSPDSLYNNGRPFNDVRVVQSLAQGFDRYSYWTCDDFTYAKDGASVSLQQRTVFVDFDIIYGGATLDLMRKPLQCEFTIDGSSIIAIPTGTSIVCPNLSLDDTFGQDGGHYYKVKALGAPDNCIPGIFSVGKDKQVFFSKGNLWYDLDIEVWGFAPSQYARCFEWETEVGENYSSWRWLNTNIDSFGWGMWLEGGGDPSYTGEDESMFPALNIENGELVGDCAIGSGWSVLSMDEWYYLFQKRPDAAKKYGTAQISGESSKGIVLLPDDFTLPEGLDFQSIDMFDFDDPKETMNAYSTDDWQRMEAAGAVFLPVVAYRYLELVDNSYHAGWYWTRSTIGKYFGALFISLYGELFKEKMSYGEGSAVRLVWKL